MSGFGTLNDIGNLSSLLAESRSAQEQSTYNQPPSAVNSSTIVVGKPDMTSKALVLGASNNSNNNSKNIWRPEEILSEDALVEWKDDRPSPRHEFSYKQIVGTEDTFLGMSDKTPLSSDCTHLVVKIHFPKATMKELDLNVTKNRIKAASKTHHLFTYLPVSVDADNGKAKFETAKEVLTITLPILNDN